MPTSLGDDYSLVCFFLQTVRPNVELWKRRVLIIFARDLCGAGGSLRLRLVTIHWPLLTEDSRGSVREERREG